MTVRPNIFRINLLSGMRKNFLAFLLSILCCTLNLSCSDLINENIDVLESDFITLTINIPNSNTSSNFSLINRASLKVLQEGTIQDLWLCAYPVNDPQGIEAIVKPLKDGQIVDDKIVYSVSGFKEGNYHIYLIANLDFYLDTGTINETLSEDNLKKIILNFTSDNFLEKGKLPMVCMPEDIIKDEIYPVGISGNIIDANLKFLCSKVRYTILYNSEAEANDINFNEGNAFNVIPQTALTSLGSTQFDELLNISSLNLSKTEYPEDNSPYFNIESSISVPTNLKVVDNWNDNSQRAWQGIVYLPENLDPETPTKLSFTARDENINENKNYDFFLYWNSQADKEAHGIERGQMYDIVAKVSRQGTTDLTTKLKVSDWDLNKISYTLQDPIELIVEKSELDLKASDWQILGFKSNIDFSFYSPVFEGKDVFIIEKHISEEKNNNFNLYDEWDNYLRVKLNPDILYDSYPDITNSEEYNYFYIIAGNLHKKIRVNFNLEWFLEVTPSFIVIEAKDLGNYVENSENISISYFTNVNPEKARIEIKDPDELLNLKSGAFYSSYLENSISKKDGVYTAESNSGKIVLNISGEDEDFWQMDHKFTLTFSLQLSDTEKKEKEVTILVKSYNLEYIIHFKNNNPELQWKSPHVYAYEYLTLPDDLSGINSQYAGKIVGYYDGSQYLPALKYAFTNNLSFVGWAGYGGNADPNYSNTVLKNGFVLMGGEGSNENKSYNPSMTTGSKYDLSTQIHISHDSGKEVWICSACKEQLNLFSEEPRLWPGIAMEPEYDSEGKFDGWWKFTLSGKAIPGKSLISFSDGHSGSEIDCYPGKKEIGIPLFDFITNEGWLLFDASNSIQNFTSNKPVSNPLPEGYFPGVEREEKERTQFTVGEVIRIYWKTKFSNYNMAWVFLEWNDTNEYYKEYPGVTYTGTYSDDTDSYYYYDWVVDRDCLKVNLIFNPYSYSPQIEDVINFDSIKDTFKDNMYIFWTKKW